MAGSEEPPAQVRGRVRLEPADIIQDMEPKHLQGEPAGIGRMVRSADPDGALVLEHPSAGPDPGEMKLEIFRYPCTRVPGSLIHGSPSPAPAGEAAVGEVVRRVGEYEIYRFLRHSVQQLDAVATIESESITGEIRGIAVHGYPATLIIPGGTPGWRPYFSETNGSCTLILLYQPVLIAVLSMRSD